MLKKEETPVYEVYNRENRRVLYSYSNKCVDSKSRIEELLKTGPKVKINGKPVTKTKKSRKSDSKLNKKNFFIF